MRRPAGACGRRALAAGLSAALALAGTGAKAAEALKKDVVFDAYSPLAANAELARRLLSPLSVDALPAALAKAGKTLREPPIDLAAERFALFAPEGATPETPPPNTPPPGGYGLLVFVPPWNEATLPDGWGPVLERAGFLFVTAAKSGNEHEVLSRRAPLAVLAAINVMKRWPVNPDKVFVGGFSGGGRVALRLALGYPDLFHGALLNAGSDPLGDGGAPLPSPELWRLLQSSRVVLVTGERDAVRVSEDAAALPSLRRWCVFNVEEQVIPWKGHDIAGAAAFERALTTLAKPPVVDPARQAACADPIEATVAARMARVAALRAAGDTAGATKERAAIDTRYGGLAGEAR